MLGFSPLLLLLLPFPYTPEEMNPASLSKAIKFVKTSLANQKVIFGSANTSLTQRQVTFSDTEGTNSKEKESSHMQRQTCLEQEIKNPIMASI
jgi:hypothetical protein